MVFFFFFLSRSTTPSPATARRVQPIITHDCGILLEKTLTRKTSKKKKKKKEPMATYNACLSNLYCTLNMKQHEGSFVRRSTVTDRETCSYKIRWSVSRDCMKQHEARMRKL